MTEFITPIIKGAMVGGIYTLIGLSIVVIYKSSSIFNFATGELVMLGGFFCLPFLIQMNLPWWIAIFGSLIIMVFLAIFINRALISPMSGQPLLSVVLMTLGISYLLRGVHMLIWGAGWIAFPSIVPDKRFNLGFATVSLEYLCYFIVAMIAFTAFIVFFQKTKLGLAMRATSEDHQLARSTGIKVRTIFSVTWISAAVLCWVAGVILGSINNLSPELSNIGLKGFPVVLFGGLESVAGCLVGGITIGILENLGAAYLNSYVGGGVQEVIPYIVMMIVLIVKPFGLFGLKRIERV